MYMSYIYDTYVFGLNSLSNIYSWATYLLFAYFIIIDKWIKEVCILPPLTKAEVCVPLLIKYVSRINDIYMDCGYVSGLSGIKPKPVSDVIQEVHNLHSGNELWVWFGRAMPKVCQYNGYWVKLVFWLQPHPFHKKVKLFFCSDF